MPRLLPLLLLLVHQPLKPHFILILPILRSRQTLHQPRHHNFVNHSHVRPRVQAEYRTAHPSTRRLVFGMKDAMKAVSSPHSRTGSMSFQTRKNGQRRNLSSMEISNQSLRNLKFNVGKAMKRWTVDIQGLGIHGPNCTRLYENPSKPMENPRLVVLVNLAIRLYVD